MAIWGALLLVLGIAQAEPWRIARLGEGGTIGDYAPVTEVMTDEMFAVAVLDPASMESRRFHRAWHSSVAARGKAHLLVVRPTQHESAARAFDEGDAKLFALEKGADMLRGHDLWLCTPEACVPQIVASFSDFDRFLVDEVAGLDCEAELLDLPRARELVEVPEAERQLTQLLTAEGRRWMEQADEAVRREGLAMVALFTGWPARMLHERPFYARLDTECRVRDMQACLAYAKSLEHLAEAGPVVLRAMGRRYQLACDLGSEVGCSEAASIEARLEREARERAARAEAATAGAAAAFPEPPDLEGTSFEGLPMLEHHELKVKRRTLPFGITPGSRCLAVVRILPDGRPHGALVAGCDEHSRKIVERSFLGWRWRPTRRDGPVVTTIRVSTQERE